MLAFNNGASGGTAILNGSDANHPLVTYTFTVNPTAPTTIGIAAADTDNPVRPALQRAPPSAVARPSEQRHGSERLTNGLICRFRLSITIPPPARVGALGGGYLYGACREPVRLRLSFRYQQSAGGLPYRRHRAGHQSHPI